jgi:hypothetical protein
MHSTHGDSGDAGALDSVFVSSMTSQRRGITTEVALSKACSEQGRRVEICGGKLASR